MASLVVSYIARREWFRYAYFNYACSSECCVIDCLLQLELEQARHFKASV